MTCAILLLLFLRPEGTPYIRGIRFQFTTALPAVVALALCMYPKTVTEALPTQITWLYSFGKKKKMDVVWKNEGFSDSWKHYTQSGSNRPGVGEIQTLSLFLIV